MENSIVRNIKNISRIALYTMSIGIAVLIAITLFQVLLDGDDMYEYIKDNLQFYFIYMCTFSVFVFNLRLSMADAQIILSFCSRRKDYLTGKYAVNAVIIVIMLVINFCIYKGGYKSDSMILTASALVALFGIGNIMGIVISKYGLIGYMIFVFVCAFFGGIIGYSIERFDVFVKLRSMGSIILATTIMFMVISMIMESRIVMKSDIKR